MRRLLLLAVIAGASACGSVNDKASCTTSASCGAGKYCAPTADGNVCWPDSTPPAVASASVTCDATPCVRDSKLTVTVSASDDAELAGVEVSLDLDAARWVALAKAGAVWTGTLALREWAFPAFSRTVVATARATDAAGNQGTKVAAGVSVTRLRWAVEALAGSAAVLSPPAVMTDGTIVVGSANHQLLSLTPAGAQAENPLAIGGGAITSIAVGDTAVWVGSDDSWIRAAALDRKSVLAGVGLSVDGAIKSGLAIRPGTGEEWAFAVGDLKRLGGASNPGGKNSPTQPLFYVAGPAITKNGSICVVASNVTASLSCYSFDGLALGTPVPGTLPGLTSAPPTSDAQGNILTGSLDAKLSRTDSSGNTTPVATLPNGVLESIVVVANGDLVVSDQGNHLHRLSSSGTALWAPAKTLDDIPLAPLALDGTTSLLVGTRAGSIYALDNAGATVWTTTLTGAPLLKGSNISPPSTETPVTSTAYFSAANGKVYAVVVDGTLDTSAPWPKAFRDRRNRSNAGLTP